MRALGCHPDQRPRQDHHPGQRGNDARQLATRAMQRQQRDRHTGPAQGHRRPVGRGHRDDRTAPAGHKLGHMQHPASAKSHQPQRRRRQPHRRKQSGDHARGHDQRTHHRHDQQVRHHPVLRRAVEIGCRQRRGRQRRDQGRDHQQRDAPQDPRQGLRAAGPCGEQQDQRGGGGKAHLEAGRHQRLGCDKQDHQRRQRNGAQRDRAAVGQHRHKHHRDHQPGALGRHPAPRKPQVGGRHHQRDQRRELVHRPSHQKADRLHSRQGQPQRGINEAREHAHVQARDRDDVVQVRVAHQLVRGLCDARAVTRHQRRRDRALLPADPALHRGRQRQPHGGRVQAARGRALDGQDGVAGIADGAQPIEEGRAAEVEAMRLGRARRRAEMARQHDPAAHLRQRDVAGQGQPHAFRRPRGRGVAQGHAVQRHPHPVAGGTVDLDHAALDGAVVAVIHHRGRHEMQPQPRREEPRQHQRQSQPGKAQQVGPVPVEPPRHRPARCQPRQPQRRQRPPQGQGVMRQVRFDVQQEPAAHPDCNQHRRPDQQTRAGHPLGRGQSVHGPARHQRGPQRLPPGPQPPVRRCRVGCRQPCPSPSSSLIPAATLSSRSFPKG